MYRDVRNSGDVDELEKKLGKLESDTATVFKQVHDCNEATITLSREQVNSLRKFMFIMHYRSDFCSENYFNPDKDDEARPWIEGLQKRENITTPIETWLHVLRYYLDTPHQDICMHGMQAARELASRSSKGRQQHVPPDLQHYPAIAYHLQGDHYYLGFWEAADDGEFILTDSCFGLWEGVHPLYYPIHRIFPMSPRIAAVLRFRSHDIDSNHSTLPVVGDLINLPLPAPVPPKYDIMFQTMQDMAEYRASGEVLKDNFSLSITKLTAAQTSQVNAVLLANIHDKGAVTFTSRSNMLRTLRDFSVDCARKPFYRSHPEKFIPLVSHLSSSKEGNIDGSFSATSGIDSPPGAFATQADTKGKSAFDQRLTGLFDQGVSLSDSSSTKHRQVPSDNNRLRKY